jgi:mycothiol synthase
VHRTDFEPEAVERFLAAMGMEDGHPPLSEHKLAIMREGMGRVGVWCDADGICVVGSVAQHDTDGHWAVEVAVAVRARTPGFERDAIDLAAGRVPDGARHTLWAFRTRQIAAARERGYEVVRTVVRLSGAIDDVAQTTNSEVDIGPMVDADIPAIVSINNRAFAGHPEQGAMTEDAFRGLTRFEWFDSAGVAVARTEQGVVGFCITKREFGAVGEVYVIAVEPDSVGRGIGRALTTGAFRQLQEQGASIAHVWTDESNRAAIGLYRSIGLSVDFCTRELALQADGGSTN